MIHNKNTILFPCTYTGLREKKILYKISPVSKKKENTQHITASSGSYGSEFDIMK